MKKARSFLHSFLQASKEKFDVEGMDVEGFFDEGEQDTDDAESEDLRQHLMKMIKGAGNPSNDDDLEGKDSPYIYISSSYFFLKVSSAAS